MLPNERKGEHKLMLDTKAIDTQIRKLQKLKEVLADEALRELIVDPEMLELMRGAVVAANGSGTHKSSKDTGIPDDTEESLPAEGSLKRKVLDAARTIPGKFNTRDIVEKLQGAGHDFGKRDPMIAVNQSLRHLAKKKTLVRLVRQGSGRIPHIYQAVRKENTSN